MNADDCPEVARRREEQARLRTLIADVRGSDQFTPREVARLERVRLLLAAEGIEVQDARAAFWLAPIVCTSGSQQALFVERFASLFDVPREELRPRAAEPPVVAEQPKPAWWWRLRWQLAAGVGLALTAAWLWWRWRASEAPTGLTSDIGQTLTFIFRPAALPPAMERAVPWLLIGLVALGFLGASLALHRLVRRWRRRRALRDFEPDHWESRPLAFAAGLPALYDAAGFRRRLGGLRRHRPVPSARIHVGRTIRATIRAGGRPVFRYGTRPQTPDCVVLADRESPRDHLPVVAHALSMRLSEEGVAATVYEYFGNPRRVRQSFPLPSANDLPLDRLGGRHPCARVLILADPEHCLDRAGAGAGWLDELPEEHAVLLNPRDENSWDWRETELEEAGIGVFPASPAGIVAYVDRVQAAEGEARHRRAPIRDWKPDLPLQLQPHRSRLIDEKPPAPGEAEDLIADLEYWLDREAMTMLRAAAVFPLVEPSLTVLLGTRLTNDAGKMLLSEERLLALARLPWLRIGRMPAWLRGPLARGLTPDQLAATLRAILAFLNPVLDGPGGRLKLDFSQADDPAARARLRDWLRRNPTSGYHDPLLIDALDDLPPEELGLEREGAGGLIGRTVAAIDLRRDAIAVAATLLLVVGLVRALPAEQRSVEPTQQDRPPLAPPAKQLPGVNRPDLPRSDEVSDAERRTDAESERQRRIVNRRQRAIEAAREAALGREPARGSANAVHLASEAEDARLTLRVTQQELEERARQRPPPAAASVPAGAGPPEATSVTGTGAQAAPPVSLPSPPPIPPSGPDVRTMVVIETWTVDIRNSDYPDELEVGLQNSVATYRVNQPGMISVTILYRSGVGTGAQYAHAAADRTTRFLTANGVPRESTAVQTSATADKLNARARVTIRVLCMPAAARQSSHNKRGSPPARPRAACARTSN